MASTIWTDRPSPARTLVVITIDGESVGLCPILDLEPDPYTENGGES